MIQQLRKSDHIAHRIQQQGYKKMQEIYSADFRRCYFREMLLQQGQLSQEMMLGVKKQHQSSETEEGVMGEGLSEIGKRFGWEECHHGDRPLPTEEDLSLPDRLGTSSLGQHRLKREKNPSLSSHDKKGKTTRERNLMWEVEEAEAKKLTPMMDLIARRKKMYPQRYVLLSVSHGSTA